MVLDKQGERRRKKKKNLGPQTADNLVVIDFTSTHPFLGAQNDAGHVKDDGQSHFSNLTQLLLLVGHADGDGINQNQWIHAFRTVLLAVEHCCTWLAARLVALQQEGTWDKGAGWRVLTISLHS